MKGCRGQSGLRTSTGVVLIVLIHVFTWGDPALLWVSWVWVLICVRVKEVSWAQGCNAHTDCHAALVCGCEVLLPVSTAWWTIF